MEINFSNPILGNLLLSIFIIVIYVVTHKFLNTTNITNILFFGGIFIGVYLLLKSINVSFINKILSILEIPISILFNLIKKVLIPISKLLFYIIKNIIDNKFFLLTFIVCTIILLFTDKSFFKFNFSNINSDNIFENIIELFQKNSISSYLINAILLFIITLFITLISYVFAAKFFKDQNNNLFVNMLKLSVIWQFFQKNNKLSFGSYYTLKFSFIFSLILGSICLSYYISLFMNNDNKNNFNVGDKVTLENTPDNNIYKIINLNEQKTKAVLVSDNDNSAREISYDVNKLKKVKPSILSSLIKNTLMFMPILIGVIFFGLFITKLDFSNVRSYNILKTLISSIFTLIPCILYSIINSYKLDFNNFSFSKIIAIIYVIELLIIFLFYTIFIDNSFIFKKDYIDVLNENKKSDVMYLDKSDINNININDVLTDKNGEILTIEQIKRAKKDKKIILSKSCKYALSFWFYLNPQGQNNTNQNKIITLEKDKNDEITILYNNNDNTLLVKTKNDNLTIPYIPFQKWNYIVINSDGSYLDIFINTEYIGKVKCNCNDNKDKLINNILIERKKRFNLLKTLEIGDKYTYGAITKIYYYNNILKNYQIINNYNTTILPK